MNEKSNKEVYDAGMALRRSMWGKAGAEDRVEQASDFNLPFENLVTEYCFGDVWNRPGLNKKTRSIITVAVLAALTKPNQLKVHVEGAIANGVSKDEIREIIMHTSIYAGIPTGVEAFNAAKETLAKLGLE